MTEHIGGPETHYAVETRHARYLRMWQTGEAHMFAIVDAATGEGLGGCGWWHTSWDGDDVCEAGWSVIPAAQGRGVATAAVKLLVAEARIHGDRHRLIAFPSVSNDASRPRPSSSSSLKHESTETATGSSPSPPSPTMRRTAYARQRGSVGEASRRFRSGARR